MIKKFRVPTYTKVEKIKDLSGLFALVMWGYALIIVWFLVG